MAKVPISEQLRFGERSSSDIPLSYGYLVRA